MLNQVSVRAVITAVLAYTTFNVPTSELLAQNVTRAPVIPRTWDDDAISTSEIPLAQPKYSPVHVPAEYYYRIPERPIYKSYPVYHPSRQPVGYLDRLRQQEPQVAFDGASLTTKADWVRAGETVFHAAVLYDAPTKAIDLEKREWWDTVKPPLTRDGVLPFMRYVIRTKGKLELSGFSCALCHTRVLPSGDVIAGAQGNYPFTRAQSLAVRQAADRETALRGDRTNYAAPWLGEKDPFFRLNAMSLDELVAWREAVPPGVNARPRTSPFSPAQIPDLIGVEHRKYLDHTGLMQHRDIGDLMRYAATNQDGDFIAQHGDFIPVGTLPPAEKFAGAIPTSNCMR